VRTRDLEDDPDLERLPDAAPREDLPRVDDPRIDELREPAREEAAALPRELPDRLVPDFPGEEEDRALREDDDRVPEEREELLLRALLLDFCAMKNLLYSCDEKACATGCQS
jgi:hypothetical protein